MGLEVKRGPDGNINVVQPPGAANALGRIKFNFPNKFQVYLHDTPEKRLFAADKRAFSHGCMRVEDPTKFGEIMLHLAMNGPTPEFAAAQRAVRPRRAHLQAHRTGRWCTSPTRPPSSTTAASWCCATTSTASTPASSAILHSDERRIADVAPPQDPKRDLATAKTNQEILRRVERREAHNAVRRSSIKLFR